MRKTIAKIWPEFLEPVQDLLRHRHLRLGGARNPHLLHVNSGFCAPSAHNWQRLVTILNRFLNSRVMKQTLVKNQPLQNVQI